MSDFKEYLPSKKFTTIILFIIVIIVLFFTIKNIAKFFHERTLSKDAPVPLTVTVETLTQKDSNNNGIADWEEYLWGLNPNKNGEKNKEIITEKKKLLTQNGIITVDDSGTITDNEMLARQFFATIVSLQQTGEIDPESLKSVADAVGQNITAMSIEDSFDINSLKIVEDSETTKNAYSASVKELVIKYQDSDIGSEMTLLAQGLANQDSQALYATKGIAKAYQDFGNEFVKIPVPRSIVPIHLEIANNYEKVGQSIDGLIQMLADPIVGMRAVITYKNYSDLLATNLENLSEILQ